MNPTWQSPCGRVRLWNADCRDVLVALEPGSVDAVVTDPPYGIDLRGSFNSSPRFYPNGKSRKPRFQYDHFIIGDDAPFDPTPWIAFPECLLWGANNYGLKAGRYLVWDKRCGICPPRTQGDCEIAWVKEAGPTRVFRHLWDGMVRESEKGIQRQHPTQKPIELMAWSLSFIKGQTIFDPFMGSGTTGIAAVKLGRRFLGVEIEPKYFAIAKDRIETALAEADADMFGPLQDPEPVQETLL